ncbi:AtpZ/AtpI family protein [Oleispirillum naphthae]|uniref:AtpZ/AtpI family protein n=1 Tax=Oleispirillum naphthae TaxID=2838853 RepID=UPI0030826A3A
MTEPKDQDLSHKLAELGSRVREARAEAGLSQDGQAPKPGGMHSLLGLGLRVTTDLVVSVGLGGALGWAADDHWGSSPWGLMIGLGVGFASGVLTVYRVVRGADTVLGPPPGKRTAAGKPGDGRAREDE